MSLKRILIDRTDESINLQKAMMLKPAKCHKTADTSRTIAHANISLSPLSSPDLNLVLLLPTPVLSRYELTFMLVPRHERIARWYAPLTLQCLSSQVVCIAESGALLQSDNV